MRILVGMSGGVDSSVSAALLVQAGHEVEGGFIKNWSDTKDLWTGECSWRAERRDAMRVAAKLGIPLHTFDFEEQYRERVLGALFREYEAGRTPNPDVLCNEEIKFGLFAQEAFARGFDAVATGHYARVVHETTGQAHLLRGRDTHKDQTYFLYRVSQEVLRRTLFPIGDLEKSQVRAQAGALGLATASKPDSQGICFVGKLDMHEFLRKRIAPTPGDIVDEHGKVLGTHDGLDAYTIGQRHGLHVSAGQKSWYVVAKRPETNQLVIVSDREHPLLYSTHATLEDLHWTEGAPPCELGESVELQLVCRYRQAPLNITLTRNASQTAEIYFHEPAWAIAAGQSAVIYDGEVCLGGGIFV